MRPRTREAPPIVRCDGCSVPNQASWMTLHHMGAYCRDCIGPEIDEYRRVAKAAYAGDEDAKVLRELQVTNHLTSPRPYTASAITVRRWMGLK